MQINHIETHILDILIEIIGLVIQNCLTRAKQGIAGDSSGYGAEDRPWNEIRGKSFETYRNVKL